MTRQQPPPQAPICQAASATAITASWYRYDSLGATGYELHYRPEGQAQWTALAPVPDHEATIEGLTPGAWHDFRLRWIDDQDHASPWSDTTFYWTPPAPAFSLGIDIEAYRQWVCQCDCPGCSWYHPCGKPTCRSQARDRILIAVNGGHAGFYDEMTIAVLDSDSGPRLAEAILACTQDRPKNPPD